MRERAMKSLAITAMAGVALAAAGAASAADVEIRNAAVRVTVIPEARGDVGVSIVKDNPRMHIHLMRFGDRVVIDGGLGMRSPNCTNVLGRRGVRAWGLGFTPYDDLPQIVIRTPLDAKVSAGGAVYGVVDRATSLELSNGGCGDWSVANVAGALTVRMAGSGDLRAGDAASAHVRIAGSSDVFLRSVNGGLDIASSGSGNLHAETMAGPLHVRIAGSGDVTVPGGQVTDMSVAVAGSGDIRFGGVAQDLDATIVGSGDVSVGRVTGHVSKHVAGSGSVTIGG
jgi:hypothetical protein